MEMTALIRTDKDPDEVKDLIQRLIGDVKIFETPLEAYAAEEGPYRVNELTNDGDIPKFDDPSLEKDMAKAVARKLAGELTGATNDYNLLDGEILDTITKEAVKELLEQRLEDARLGEKDATAAESFLDSLI